MKIKDIVIGVGSIVIFWYGYHYAVSGFSEMSSNITQIEKDKEARMEKYRNDSDAWANRCIPYCKARHFDAETCPKKCQ